MEDPIFGVIQKRVEQIHKDFCEFTGMNEKDITVLRSDSPIGGLIGYTFHTQDENGNEKSFDVSIDIDKEVCKEEITDDDYFRSMLYEAINKDYPIRRWDDLKRMSVGFVQTYGSKKTWYYIGLHTITPETLKVLDSIKGKG